MRQVMKRRSIGYLVFVLLLFVGQMAIGQKHKIDDTTFTRMMDRCKTFVENYKPTYINGEDTLAVSMITMPPDDINKFLFDCIENKNFKPLKYSAVIFIKQRKEYDSINHQDYELEDSTYAMNGFVEMIKVKMGFGHADNKMGNMVRLYTGDVCEWVWDNTRRIDDFDYVRQFGKDPRLK
jgi:hypothetical protein